MFFGFFGGVGREWICWVRGEGGRGVSSWPFGKRDGWRCVRSWPAARGGGGARVAGARRWPSLSPVSSGAGCIGAWARRDRAASTDMATPIDRERGAREREKRGTGERSLLWAPQSRTRASPPQSRAPSHCLSFIPRSFEARLTGLDAHELAADGAGQRGRGARGAVCFGEERGQRGASGGECG